MAANDISVKLRIYDKDGFDVSMLDVSVSNLTIATRCYVFNVTIITTSAVIEQRQNTDLL